MKLVKSICIRCANGYRRQMVNPTGDSNEPWKWDFHDEDHWRKGEVVCPIKASLVGSAIIKTEQEIPKWCHYALEQLLSQT